MEDSLRKIYEDHASLLDFLTDTGMAPPPALEVAANYAINASLFRALEAEIFNAETVTQLIERARAEHITLNGQRLGFSAGQRMKRAMVQLEGAMAGDNAAATLANTLILAALPICPSRSTCGRRKTSGTTCCGAATRPTGPKNFWKASADSPRP